MERGRLWSPRELDSACQMVVVVHWLLLSCLQRLLLLFAYYAVIVHHMCGKILVFHGKHEKIYHCYPKEKKYEYM